MNRESKMTQEGYFRNMSPKDKTLDIKGIRICLSHCSRGMWPIQSMLLIRSPFLKLHFCHMEEGRFSMVNCHYTLSGLE